MLTLIQCRKTAQGYQARITGPRGTIEIVDLVWIADRQDLLAIVYWEAWAVLQGAYHCCLSIPGKVLLIE
jgi:hypothetical protein